VNQTRSGFSVIIPVYNGEAFIARAIESCLQQTVLPDEIIVIDDASNDKTGAIIHSLNSDLIRYERNTENRGPSFSRNCGMQLASSAWIMFLDADDIFHPQKIEIIRYCIKENKNIKAIGHSFDIINTSTVPINKHWQQSLPILKNIPVNEVLIKNPVVTPALTVSSKNGILFNEQMAYAEDHDFILRTAEQFGIWHLDMSLCSLQRRPLTPGGLSHNKWKMRKGEMKMYIDYCNRHNKYLAMPFLLLFSLLKHTRNFFIR
jgi:teichuronic acid biosynthesis glycosyltransferase TuaG